MKKSVNIRVSGRKVKNGKGDRVFYAVCYIILGLLTLSVLYPLVYIVSASISSPAALARGLVWLWPVDITLDGYKAVFNYEKIWIGFRNTFFYMILGTFINVSMTLICAYPLSRKNLIGRSFFTFLFSFTMLFGGGMIPNYLLVRNLGLIDTIWAMVIPGAMGVHNMIITRTFIQSNIPDELLESAKMDGCNDFKYFFKVLLPLSKTIIAVLVLWHGVGHWNAYFNAFLYLYDMNLYPLQIFVRDILVADYMGGDLMSDPTLQFAVQQMKLLLKYSVIVITTVPVFAFYPLVQKYFVKGVMIGSLKG